jgi:predicted tellurium resistance membrane protein TerC
MDTVMTPFQQFVQYLPYIIPIVLAELLLIIIALVDLARREKVRYIPKWAWALLIIFVQFIGAIGYLIFGREE